MAVLVKKVVVALNFGGAASASPTCAACATYSSQPVDGCYRQNSASVLP